MHEAKRGFHIGHLPVQGLRTEQGRGAAALNRNGGIRMRENALVEKLEQYIDARFPILYIHTFEEEKADRLIQAAARRKTVIEWNGVNGFVEFQHKTVKATYASLDLFLSAKAAAKDLDRHLLVIKDIAALLRSERQESQKVIALLKEIARKIRNGAIDATVILVAPTVVVPKELEKLITVLRLELPTEQEIHGLIEDFIQEQEIQSVYPNLLDEMSNALKGLSELEIKDLLRLSISSDDNLTRKTLQLIFEQKQQMILKAGILEMVQVKENVDDIGGLEILKEWLLRKAKVFKDINRAEAYGVPVPKGVLIAGLPGCGKSLTAKAASSLLGVPLLKLDMGRLMGKYVGESEENMRRAIELAEAMSPCVLWIDELEKAFAGIGNSGSDGSNNSGSRGGSGGGSEVTTRMFGSFLTWMQEKTCAAFVIATANDITNIPPELMRKGRFDEIFYVALPNPEERRKIFEIHLTKRRKEDMRSIDIDRLVSATEGYSGADIESVVGESVESAFVKDSPHLTIEEILDCIANTHPMKEIMEEQINHLSKLYEERKFKKASR